MSGQGPGHRRRQGVTSGGYKRVGCRVVTLNSVGGVSWSPSGPSGSDGAVPLALAGWGGLL